MSEDVLPKIGGEIGEVRASIDVESLNVYLTRTAPVIATPVTVKQFKVCRFLGM